MSKRITHLPFISRYDDVMHKKVVDALYQQWKHDQQLEKAKVLAANIDLFFGVTTSSDTSSVTSVETKNKAGSGVLTGLIKRGYKKMLGKSKSRESRGNEERAEDTGEDQAASPPLTPISRADSIDKDRRNAKGMGYDFSDFDLMMLELSHSFISRE
ncbi:hypothetical protein E3P92_02597 [Wallemia ichthyophaga]|uniref:Uncharacterized protein n=2 Tax=Wallemia ichthyophaga TaxID=245174 RepID=A0A4T0HEX8_WALIC|nr:uncharacterized protein J056_001791 [Wallemia ichthyophaga EXF-994]TIA98677.1 hypothetical protein E3P95_02371 [Wallemia ichthyophaga]EOQ99468.1 hypothetical protein J056_001791 [Wallemia ichthyophaga EXF-994]TIA99716.1 hypothetical protein E3P94_02442 [Wallemia ichthyophaga]TIB11267.1 hypothetical protein E3P90_02492 [Wallemia ichthyophaga]TIB12003.1 hypothetical protein E3P93_02389 [Wallemia ichthyophaga]